MLQYHQPIIELHVYDRRLAAECADYVDGLRASQEVSEGPLELLGCSQTPIVLNAKILGMLEV